MSKTRKQCTCTIAIDLNLIEAKILKRTLRYSASAAVLAVLSLFVGCNNDDDDPTIAEIYAVNEAGEVIQNANVSLVCESSVNPAQPCIVGDTGRTNSTGLFRSEFALPAVMKITSFKVTADTQIFGILPDTSMIITRDSLCGETFITVLEGDINRQTVVLYECK